ncbi:NAD-dependent epimerase/dehydratase family protein [Flavobacterium sp. JLP]|uniref:NAD-dependent epimerase/dehydratase family protein n=1 Tax=Flavobacterium sp. JLP TaxID=2783793 RepID=UPI00188A5071|nr:NAD-dependent epimerase/dehydratase family protein [Flavobacterium sp. JLP]MBF4507169.1 NAD-dependent epimerase/dehydratase family protein [Flavobacterium sp. JLP]
MKQILITGAYGFLGRNVAREFKKSGNYVAGIGHGKWDKDEYSKWGIDEWYETTITFEALLNINHKFDIIVHCGGSGSVGFSWENPYEDFQKSVQSTLSILEYIRLQNNKCKFIYPSSPAVQGNLDHIRIKEEMVSTPVSPYGFHKKIAEEICLSYHNNFNIDIGIIRYFSIYGDGLQKQLLWDACKKIDKLEHAVFFGTGKETRDWIHVSDAASLLCMFSLKLAGFEVINGGSGIETSIYDIISMLNKYIGKSTEIEFNGNTKEGDPMHFWADIEKSKSLNWEPTISIEDGIKQYVQYFKSLNND